MNILFSFYTQKKRLSCNLNFSYFLGRQPNHALICKKQVTVKHLWKEGAHMSEVELSWGRKYHGSLREKRLWNFQKKKNKHKTIPVLQ